ncbi:protein disulfide isomerase precursor, putative [Theileria equi strain WA]|uniref:protein disulfide-isomerase n=1 Tax=Theileria equi strain WA TaxID=1537102 RepID=L0AZ25_THEEQ|nr:protein disulfide isomerase precursor, putative [Theileria equi strain WA]AFZ80493.1 protein disulfide isomerase precursor, putative [Theileria equi strain WA]|eukprot:XP_004830159.1 protein disulfide isomerase precursor, putative [Theileria equi strain WA]
MDPRVILNGFLISMLVCARIAHSMQTITISPLPPSAHLTESTYDEYVSNSDRATVILRYPSITLFSSSVINDYKILAHMFKDNPKCRFAMYQTNVSLDSNISLLEPHLTYVKDGKLATYDGPLNVGFMLSWITQARICDMKVKDLETFKLHRTTLPAGHIQTFVLFDDQGYNEETFNRIIDVLVENNLFVPCGYIDNRQLSETIIELFEYDTSIVNLPNIIVLKNMPHLYNVRFYYRDINDKDELKTYLVKELIPPVHRTDSYMFPQLLTMNKIIVYIYTRNDDLKNYIQNTWYLNVPREHLDRLIFVHSKGSQIIENKLNNLLVIDADYVKTAVRAFEVRLETLEFKKYRPVTLPDGKITEEGLNDFIKDLESGRLRHYIKSELAIPEHIDKGAVKTIVGEDFHKRVIESDNDVLIVFYSPWCGHCHISKRIFRDIGRRLKDDHTLTIATFDAYNNEVEDVEIANYPTIALFPHGAKHEPIFYDGLINLEGIAQFIEENCRKCRITAENLLQRHVGYEPIFEMHSEL